MVTIVINTTSCSTFTPNEGDIYIIENDAQGDFTFLGDANFEVLLSDAGAYGQGDFGNSADSLDLADKTDPTVMIADAVDATAIRRNANGNTQSITRENNVGSADFQSTGSITKAAGTNVENTAELMCDGCDDFDGATDCRGRQISSGRIMPFDLLTCDAGFRAVIGLEAHTGRFTNGSAVVSTGINLGVHANGNY